MSPIPPTPPDTTTFAEGNQYGYLGQRTDPLPDEAYVPGVQADLSPTLTGATPATGGVAGGTAVVLAGTLLFSPVVTIGGQTAVVTAAADDGTSVDCVAPPGLAGAADIAVTTPGGTVTLTGGFTYA